jgi:amino acid transporter
VCIIFFTFLNCTGVKQGSKISKLLTFLKLLLILILFILSIIYVNKNPIIITNNLSYKNSFKNSNNFSDFFSGMIACLWSFEGWGGIYVYV